MLFLAFLVYAIVFPGVFVATKALISLPQWLFLVVVDPAAYGISLLLSFYGAYLVDVYAEQFKGPIRSFLRVLGVRWLCWLTAIVIAVCFALDFFYFRVVPSVPALSYLLPLLGVSILNALGIDMKSSRLESTSAPRRATIPSSPPEPAAKEEFVRDVRWKFNDKPYTVHLVIRRMEYENFKNRTRQLDFSRGAKEYATGGITGEIRQLAQTLLRQDIAYGTFEEVRFILSFVQNALTYRKDEGGEYPRYPVESLVDAIGDCEDYSILGAAIFKCIGYDVALLHVKAETMEHMALGICGEEGLPGYYAEHEDKRYYYCEMTADGWQMGQLPEDLKDAVIKVYPVPNLEVKVDLLEESTITS